MPTATREKCTDKLKAFAYSEKQSLSLSLSRYLSISLSLSLRLCTTQARTPRVTRPNTTQPALADQARPQAPRSAVWLAVVTCSWAVLVQSPGVSAGETWGVVSICPIHCVCRNLSESLSTDRKSVV